MTTSAPQPVPAPNEAFPYEEMRRYLRGELADPERAALIADKVNRDPRWQTHWESIRSLDLELAAAVQDARDLRGYLKELVGEAEATAILQQLGPSQAGNLPAPKRSRVATRGRSQPAPTPPLRASVSRFCKAVAWSEGSILVAVCRDHKDSLEGKRADWARHVDECVYCRRMQRTAFARLEEQRLGGEPLLREWLLGPHYQALLDKITHTIFELSIHMELLIDKSGSVALRGNPDWTLAAPGKVRTRGPNRAGAVRTRGGATQPKPLPRVLQLNRALTDPGYRLGVEFRIGDQDLTCRATLTGDIPAGKSLSEVVLELAFGTARPSSQARGTAQQTELVCTLTMAVADLASGEAVWLTVRKDQEIWEKSSFQLKAET